jgi:hypothetical protein
MSPTPSTNEPALSNEQTERMRALAQGGDKDAERVLTLARAADQENAGAQFYLAHSLQEGTLGLTRDPERARKLFARAAKNGYPGAQQELDRLEKPSTSSPVPKAAGVSINLPALTPKPQEVVRFDDAIIRLAVRAYILSVPMFFKENDLIPLMAANKAHFLEDGMVILYLKTAGSAMAQGALAFHGGKSAQGMFGMNPDMQHMAGQADAQMKSQGIAVGQDFLWLAKVLPSAAMGNYAPFQARSQLSPLRQQMLIQVQMFKMNPQMAQPMIAQMQQLMPTFEEELYGSVCQLDIGLPAGYVPPQPQSVPLPLHPDSDGSTGTAFGQHASIPPVDQFRVAAEKGDVHAQYLLGVAYATGQGVQHDDTEAVRWYLKAAEQGFSVAQYTLGVMYASGQGIQHDDAEAVRWYLKAAEQGLALAQNNLGVCYDKGQGAAQDNAKAVDWYRRAAEQGLALAQCNLGVMYEQGRGVEQNYAEAANLHRKAAEQGLALAQCNLGVMYANGQGVQHDDTEAVRWYLKAAEQGFAEAQNNLGAMYAQGLGVKQSWATALAWYTKAAEQGNADGQGNLNRLKEIMTEQAQKKSA